MGPQQRLASPAEATALAVGDQQAVRRYQDEVTGLAGGGFEKRLTRRGG